MPIHVSANGRHHPATTAELSELLGHAFAHRTQVRVIGAGLSTPRSVHVDGTDGTTAPPEGQLELVLDLMRDVVFEHEEPAGEHAIVSVGAGCLLGRAYDDLEGSSWPDTLSYQLTQKGYALDQLAGVSHQSLAGMMMTGTSARSPSRCQPFRLNSAYRPATCWPVNSASNWSVPVFATISRRLRVKP